MGFLLLGLDSLIVCLAVGPIVSRRVRLPLAAAFGIADGVAFLIGVAIGLRIPDALTGFVQTATLVGLGVYLLVVASGSRRITNWPLWVLPLALCFDNLTYGLVGRRSASNVLSQAGSQALSSALLALIGLLVAVALPRVIPALNRRGNATQFAGGALILAAGLELLVG
jgi:hypothetical protein